MTATETAGNDSGRVLDEARTLAGDYGFGEALDLRPLPEGYANTNYALETSSGTFLYRICRQKSSLEIAAELSVLEHLESRGFKAAFAIRRTDGSAVSSTPSGPVVLYQYIEGDTPELSPQAAAEAAWALGELHKIEPPPGFDRLNFVQLKDSQELASRFGGDVHGGTVHGDRTILGRFLEQTAILREMLGDEELPRGLVHADLFPENTIFQGGKLAAVIDFEECCIDSFLFDVGTAINGFCFVDNRLEPELLGCFLREYDSSRSLEESEKRLLPAAIRWGAHGQICWHLDLLSARDYPRSSERTGELLTRLEALEELDLPALCTLKE